MRLDDTSLHIHNETNKKVQHSSCCPYEITIEVIFRNLSATNTKCSLFGADRRSLERERRAFLKTSCCPSAMWIWRVTAGSRPNRMETRWWKDRNGDGRSFLLLWSLIYVVICLPAALIPPLAVCGSSGLTIVSLPLWTCLALKAKTDQFRLLVSLRRWYSQRHQTLMTL